ncbi:MAG: thiopurine S-methyltransferase [Archangium sp.]
MEQNFWSARWSEGKIGFHEGTANHHLEAFLDRLGPPGVVFVPLCGKAFDLAWLASKGFRVIGVEWVEDAVRAFFSEQSLTPSVSSEGKLKRYEAKGITVFAGDVFDVTSEHLKDVTALYDRAALIALPEATRAKYVAHLRTVLPATAKRGLLVTVEYDQSKMDGPPHSVVEAEVRGLWAGAGVELLRTEKADGPRFTNLEGLEKCFALSPR